MSFKRLPYALLALAPIVALGACSDDSATSTSSTADSGVLPPLGGDAGADGGGGATGAIQGAGGDVRIPGLTAGVSAVYDKNGFLHISAKTDNDAFATLGYFHAANRFFFMDFVRSAVRGQLGTKLDDASTFDQDVSARAFFADPNTGDPLPDVLYGRLSAENKAVFDAYAAGVNAWLADVKAGKNGAKLTEEYGFVHSDNIQPWLPADCFAVALYSLNDLSNNAQQEIALGKLAAQLPGLAGTKPAAAKALQDMFFDFRGTYDMNALGNLQPLVAAAPAKAKGLAATANALAQVEKFVKRIPGTHGAVGDTGSNNWVIGGTKTEDGRPVVANDPHLQLTNPSIWFPVEVDGKTGGTGTYHVAGGSFPGIPTIQTGHNEDLAWGVTVSFWDLADVYADQFLTVANELKVVSKGAFISPVSREVEFTVKGLKQKKTLLWVPGHGPVVQAPDADTGIGYTIRWRGLDGSTDLEGFLGIGRAKNLAEAKTALGLITTANQNFVVADKNGDIGYYPFSKVPQRPWAKTTPDATHCNPYVPMDGKGACEWGDPVDVANMPQATNPAKGFIATANGDIGGQFRTNAPFTWSNFGTLVPPVSGGPLQTFAHAEGAREQRIVDLITAKGNANSVESSRVIQGDTTPRFAEVIAGRMLKAAAATAEGGFSATEAGTAAVISALTAWQGGGTYSCPSGIDGLDALKGAKTADATVAREAVGCAAFHVALYELFDAAFGDELAIASAGRPSSYATNEIPLLVRSAANDSYNPASETFWIDNRVTSHVTTRNEILQRSLTKAGALLTAALGASTDDWRWGRFHTAWIKSLLPSALGFDAGRFPAPGGLFTVNVSNPSGVTLDPNAALIDQFAATAGPSVRTLIQVGTDTPHMKMMLPGGADLHRSGRFYNNLIPGWLSDTPVDFPFGAGAVTDPAATISVNVAASH